MYLIEPAVKTLLCELYVCVFTSRSYVKSFDLMEIRHDIILHYILMQHLYNAVLFWKFLLCMLLDLHMSGKKLTPVFNSKPFLLLDSLENICNRNQGTCCLLVFATFFMHSVLVQSQKKICCGHIPT